MLPAVLACAAASFAAVEAADIYFPVIGLPEWTFRLVAVLSLLGLPVVIALAWIFDISWSGVRRTGPDQTTDPPAGTIGRLVPVSRASRVAVAGAAVVLALAAAAFVATREGVLPAKSGDDTTGGTGVLRFGVRQLTAEPGVEWFPSISPDGAWLVYAGAGVASRDILLRGVGGQNVINLTADSSDDDDQPAFSPDAQWIVFRSERDGGGLFLMGRAVGVWSADGTRIATGTVRAHAYILDPSRPFAEQVPDTLRLTGVAGARFSPNDWSADGLRLAGSDGYRDTGIITYDFTTGRYERLTDVGQWPVWLPDGRTLLFVTGGKAFYTIDRVTREQRRVFAVDHDVIGPPRLSREADPVFQPPDHRGRCLDVDLRAVIPATDTASH